ncbi:hypothetical protein [uncultured Thiohalocapsa sp.]|uniref:hypothetical protein n=1 Tax=uncultured Thiohalocapsa sp. TaxID=768990 RepID=UPI0025EE567F|nr:hypothetical protein [uncultured Thiohalocapsa sp.]
MRLQPLIRDLKTACTEIERTSSPEGFAAEFHDFEERVGDNALLSDHWQQFRESLLYPELDDQPQAIRMAQPPEYHFHRDALLGRKLNLRLYNAMPNLLTGAGILGTFVGLVAGIYLASGGLASDDIDQAKQAMQTLLNGASLAFITSIVGLVSSIAFSIGEKRGVHRFDELLGRWVNDLEQRLLRVTPEKLAQEQLLQTRQQTQVLQGFTDQLAFQIADAFDQRLQAHVSDSIAPALGKLVDGVEALREDRQKSDEAVLEKLLATFTGELKGATGTEMDALATTLTELNASLKAQTEDAEQRHRENQTAAQQSAEQLAELFNQGTKDFQDAVGRSVEKMSKGVEAIVEKLTQQQQQATADNTLRLKSLSEAFARAVSGLNESLSQMHGITTDNQHAAAKLATIIEGLDATVQRMQGLAEPITAAAEGFQASAAALTGQVETLQSAAGVVRDSATQLEASNARTEASWQDYARRFESIDEALGNAFTELTNGVQSFTTQVSDLVADLDKHTAEISDKLYQANHDLGERVEELSDAIGSVKRS